MSDQRLAITLTVDAAPIERELRRLSRSFRRWVKRRRGTDRRCSSHMCSRPATSSCRSMATWPTTSPHSTRPHCMP